MKRTSLIYALMSADDPKRTSDRGVLVNALMLSAPGTRGLFGHPETWVYRGPDDGQTQLTPHPATASRCRYTNVKRSQTA